MKKRGQIRWDITSKHPVAIWGVLGVLMSYEITRGITLVVGRVTERV